MNGWMNRNLRIWTNDDLWSIQIVKGQKIFKNILNFVQKIVDFPIKYSKIKEYFCIRELYVFFQEEI